MAVGDGVGALVVGEIVVGALDGLAMVGESVGDTVGWVVLR